MKSLKLFLMLLIFPGILGAQNHKLSDYLLKGVRNENQTFQRNEKKERHCITPYLMLAKKHQKELTPEALNFFRKAGARPTYTGTEMVASSIHFDFHFTSDGSAGSDTAAQGAPTLLSHWISQLMSI